MFSGGLEKEQWHEWVNESWYFQNFNAGPEYMRRFI